MTLYDFDEYKKEYIFEFILVNETPLSIGSGHDPTGILDNPVVRLHNKPYIPGSSLKGVLRSEAERFAKSVYGDKEDIVCNIFSKEDSDPKNEKHRAKNNKDYKPCLICQIFGGPTIASRIKIYNAELNEDSNKQLTEIINRVSIDRVTGAQYPGRLFDMEYVVPRLKFKWRISIENIELLSDATDDNAKKVLSIINYLLDRIFKRGLEVGGKRSIGLGLLKVESFRITEYSLDKGVLKESDITDSFKERFMR